MWGIVYLLVGHAKCLLSDKRTTSHFLFIVIAHSGLVGKQNLKQMGLFGRGVNINVNSDVASNDNQARAEIHVISRSTIRQQRKFAKENYKRDLDKHYRELAFAKYDANDPKQIVDTMTQLDAFISARPVPGVNEQKHMIPYINSAAANLKTGIALLKSIDPSNPMIAHFEGVIAECAKAARMAQMAWASFFFAVLAGLFCLAVFLITQE